ncbi:helix-turn-helix transcriptional regulator [Salmonella enterica]|nr:XRE family transcriptional regulator [Salmonella enterica]EDC8053316.1 helix-turn-helix domain-containing protein [Salmonella enterica subsp. enterica serovar Muenchen]EIR0330841.1 helix-turn-helix transcriptional regulator [Salmonella enterica subsp. enterica serovar Give]KAB3084535.1 helix-turn-helix transcriptional regulator [Escherichia coli]EAW3718861.1 helix-turn-helix transcriptional regulator [Salmonella enterica]
MKYKTLKQVHSAAMHDPEYREAYEAEEAAEQLRDTLASWRKKAGLTSAQVAERMGIKPPTVSRMEKNASKMSFETLNRYAKACGVHFKIEQI